MSFLKKFFKNKKESSVDKKIQEQPVSLSTDDLFVHNFIQKGGKFLYCTQKSELIENLKGILLENSWNSLTNINSPQLTEFYKNLTVSIETERSSKSPVFIDCEHLISDSGGILLSSNQLKDNKLYELSSNFIVYAKTSQLVKNMGEGLTGIKSNCTPIPTNICAINNYSKELDADNFIALENSNSKNLYLLLFEDL